MALPHRCRLAVLCGEVVLVELGEGVLRHEILLRSRLGLMQGDADVQTVPEGC